MMRIFLFGTGNIANSILNKIREFPKSIEILGFVDNDSCKWGRKFCGRHVYPPIKIQETNFDIIIILSEIYFETIKDELIYWYQIDSTKIKGHKFLLKLLLIEKYRDVCDVEIQETLRYWEKNEISVYNQYVDLKKERHIVHWDYIENMPYIIFEDKRMYFPYNYKFDEYEGKKVVIDIMAEQQQTSPHLYVKDDIKVEQGDIIVDAGVQEGNFSLKYIEKVSKAYLFECNTQWIKPLQKTFEKFKNKVLLCNKFLGRVNNGIYVNLDNIISGQVDFLKMDIEGAEIEALLGGSKTLTDNNIKCAICSYHKRDDEREVKYILETKGYKTSTSKGYMIYYYDNDIFSTLDFRRGIVYAKKE